MFSNAYSEQTKHSEDSFFSALIKAGLTPHDQTKTVYKYVSIATAKAILEKCSLKFSSPLIFNDPFEMNPGFLDFEVSKNELNKRLIQILQNKNQNLTTKQLQNLSGMSIKDMIDPYRKAFEIQRQRILLLCTSRTFQSTLMWSHYAENHKGICLGFIMPTIYADFDMFTLNVNYTSEIKPLKVLAGSGRERSIALYKWINTKSKVWAYEEEVRSCIPNLEEMNCPANNFQYIPIDPQQIREIYFGVGTEKKDIETLNSIIKNRKYSIEKYGFMNISNSTFDLECSLINK